MRWREEQFAELEALCLGREDDAARVAPGGEEISGLYAALASEEALCREESAERAVVRNWLEAAEGRVEVVTSALEEAALREAEFVEACQAAEVAEAAEAALVVEVRAEAHAARLT